MQGKAARKHKERSYICKEAYDVGSCGGVWIDLSSNKDLVTSRHGEGHPSAAQRVLGVGRPSERFSTSDVQNQRRSNGNRPNFEGDGEKSEVVTDPSPPTPHPFCQENPPPLTHIFGGRARTEEPLEEGWGGGF